MKDCTKCIHAEWYRTASGKLHPSGGGQCKKEILMPALPASKYWAFNKVPSIEGGYIGRRKELKDHCVYWAKKN